MPIGILLFLCNQQDLNLRTSFQTASQYGAAVWEKPPAEVSIMSGNQSHSDQEKQDADWHPAFLCNQQDLNLQTSFQTASQYGAAVWEKPPAEVSIMSGNQSHSDQEKQDADWYPAFSMQSARLELANEFPNGKPVWCGCLGETSGGGFDHEWQPKSLRPRKAGCRLVSCFFYAISKT